MRTFQRALAQLIGIVFSFVVADEGLAKPPLEAVEAHYVVLGQAPTTGATVALARLILKLGHACPMIAGAADGKIQMIPRRNPHLFPVMVCEAPIGFSQGLAIELDGIDLPLPAVKESPKKIVVFGDTGCEPTKEGQLGGCPPGAPARPFQALAQSAAMPSDGNGPDLVVHLGDINYRGTSVDVLFPTKKDGTTEQVEKWVYDAGDETDKTQFCEQGKGEGFVSQNEATSSFPDSWARWREDFFEPARELLAAAPWIVVRGNHELCSRAGPGWFTFLDPSSDGIEGGRQLSCPIPDPAKDAIDNVVLSAPYAVDLKNLRLVVVDSANACDDFAFPGPFAESYRAQIDALPRLTKSAHSSWLISHRPLWGVEDFQSAKLNTGCTAGDANACINQTLQTAIDDGLNGALPASIKLLLAGHMHRFQAITFPGEVRPPMIVVGNSGVELDAENRVGDFEASVQGLKAHVLATGGFLVEKKNHSLIPAHGYLSVDYADDGSWQAKMINPALTWATCGSDHAKTGRVCTLEDGVTAWGRSK